MTPESRFLNACRCRKTDATPIWLMRQAGRYMPEYRLLRERYSLSELIKNPDLATEVTLQPIKAFDLDAAIIFADILTILECLGSTIEFTQTDGPVVHNPINADTNMALLPVRDIHEVVDFTLTAIGHVRRALNSEIPLIGFSGAPFTLASYAIENGNTRNFFGVKRFLYEQPELWHQLMSLLSTLAGDYLNAQIDAGVDVVQLFDSWVGSLSPNDFSDYAKPYIQQCVRLVRRRHPQIPIIYFGTGTAGLLHLFRDIDADVIGVDWRIDIDEAWNRLGNGGAIQGNLDPAILFGPPHEIRRRTQSILDAAAGRNGHIFNLGHGVLKETPVDHVKILIDCVREYRPP